MKKLLIILSIALLSFSGCGYKEGVKTEASQAYLYFTGFSQNNSSVSVSIDNSEEFHVTSGENNHYLVQPGKHIVKVYKNGELVVEREIYVGDGIAKEIKVH